MSSRGKTFVGGSFADLRRWVQENAGAANMVDVLQQDQIDRWRSDDPVPAEAFLALVPSAVDRDEAFDLVVGELNLRRERDQEPEIAEYLTRFPQFAGALEDWFALCGAFDPVEAHPAGPLSHAAPEDRPNEAPHGEPELATAVEPDREGAAGSPGWFESSHEEATISALDRVSDELAKILRKRLQAVAFALLAFTAVFAAMVASHSSSGDGVGSFGWPGVWWSGSGAVVAACSLLLLVRRQTWSLTALRGMELVLFGGAAGLLSWLRYHVVSGSLAGQYLGPAHADLAYELELVRNNVAWFCTIVLYGVVIPNSGRRCLAVTLVLIAIPLLLGVVAGMAGSASIDKIVTITSGSLMILTVGGTIGVFGATKLAALQREVQTARELGQYRLRRRLGAGGMGEVYLAQHRLLKRPCAIKLIQPHRAADPQTVARFEREVQATVQLSSPNTVRVYDFGRAVDGRLFYVMEYLEGDTLDELVRKNGPLAAAETVHVLRQVCGALAEAHAAGLVHRDLKPSNIMVCRQGGQEAVAKLLDFGLVSLTEVEEGADRLTMSGQFFGTPAFMAPEQFLQPESVDARADIFSLGAVAYFVLTGKAPFDASRTYRAILVGAKEQSIPLREQRPDLPAPLRAVIERCLREDREERFASADELDKALAPCEET